MDENKPNQVPVLETPSSTPPPSAATQPSTQTPTNPPPAPESNGTVVKPKSSGIKSKFPIILIIVLLLIILLAVGVFFWRNMMANNKPAPISEENQQVTQEPTLMPSPSSSPSADMSDWKTYESAGFSLKYPPDWTEVKIDNLVRFFSPGSEPENQSIATGKSEYIEIFTSKLDPKTCRGDCSPSGTLVNANDLGKINPANYKTSEGLIGGMCACEVDKIYLKNGNLYYILGLYGITDTQKTPPTISSKNELIFQQILSTFKFTQ